MNHYSSMGIKAILCIYESIHMFALTSWVSLEFKLFTQVNTGHGVSNLGAFDE